MGVVKGSRRGYEVQCHYAMCARDLAAEEKMAGYTGLNTNALHLTT